MKPLTHRPKDPRERQRLRDDLSSSIRTICGAWDLAQWDAASRGYPAGSLGNVGSSSDTSDPTFAAACHPDHADDWIRRTTKYTLVLLRASAATSRGERAWTGPFSPPAMTETLVLCASDLVELWPTNFGSLVLRLHDLSDQARKNWPPKPRRGEVVDGVKVGERTSNVETCTECKGPIAGGAPETRRIDGKPYCIRPCWETARKRKQRAARGGTRPASIPR